MDVTVLIGVVSGGTFVVGSVITAAVMTWRRRKGRRRGSEMDGEEMMSINIRDNQNRLTSIELPTTATGEDLLSAANIMGVLGDLSWRGSVVCSEHRLSDIGVGRNSVIDVVSPKKEVIGCKEGVLLDTNVLYHNKSMIIYLLKSGSACGRITISPQSFEPVFPNVRFGNLLKTPITGADSLSSSELNRSQELSAQCSINYHSGITYNIKISITLEDVTVDDCIESSRNHIYVQKSSTCWLGVME